MIWAEVEKLYSCGVENWRGRPFAKHDVFVNNAYTCVRLAGSRMVTVKTPLPVSYTHLDVYKRQYTDRT